MANETTEIMANQTTEITTTNDWRTRALIIGGVIGAVIGVAGAYLLVQRSTESEAPEISLREGIKIGVLVLGLLRSIANL